MTLRTAVSALHEFLDQALKRMDDRPRDIQWIVDMGVTREEAAGIWKRTIGSSGHTIEGVTAALDEVYQKGVREKRLAERTNHELRENTTNRT